MGLIQKQSLSGTIYSYIGVILGFVTTGLLWPRVFDTDEVGLMRILVSYSVLFSQFASLGINSITVKLFPYFRTSDGKNHGFLGLTTLISLAGLAVSILGYILMKSWIVDPDKVNSQLFNQYYYYVVPLIFFTLFFNVIDTYFRVLYKAVIGIVYKEVVQRMMILLVIVLFYLDWIDFHQTVIFYCLALILPTLFIMISLIIHGKYSLKPNFRFVTPKLRKEMIDVGLFGIIGGFSGVLVLNIDVIMVERMIDLKAAGIYTITFFFGSLILIPMRSMGKISSVIIAEAWKTNNLKVITDIYKKSSISLSVIGFLLFIGIWANIDNVFIMIGDKYSAGKYVILLLGIANLTDIALGVNPHIILNSKYYRNLSYFLLFFATLLVITNLIFIPLFGIIGAAIASLMSKIIYNTIKFLFLLKTYKLQPFDRKYAYLLIISILVYISSLLIPPIRNYLIDIFVRSSYITLIFLPLIYFSNISEDINQRIRATLKMVAGLVGIR
ncbi:MAG: polysaccharide biosynthesis C-terminal domain-containing protein [Bacteroidales bacterium]|jgi:O-antigen/teichoic acid export membrane protein